MKTLKIYEKFETTATFTWLLMDFFWMNGYKYFSTMFGTLTIAMSIFALIIYSGEKKSIKLALLAVCFWVLTNYCWLISDYYGMGILKNIANISFVICLFFSIFAFVISRKEKETLDFKRMKID